MKRNIIETKFTNFYLKLLEGMDLLPIYWSSRLYLVIALTWFLLKKKTWIFLLEAEYGFY